MTIKSKIGLSIHNANEELQKRCMDSALSIYGKPALRLRFSKNTIDKLLNFPTSKLPKTPEEMWDRRDKNTH